MTSRETRVMNSKDELIWYEDAASFITNQNYYIILPSQHMSLEQKLNALVRFFLYFGVIVALLRANYRYLFFGIIAAMLSILLYENEKRQKVLTEKFLNARDLDIVNNQVCIRSTVENPFMNPSIVDIEEQPYRPAACSLDHPKVQEVVENNFEARLFRDVGDLYGNQSSQRQFYTMPATTIPNDQTSFAKWCYGKGASCKDGNGEQCYNNLIEDVQRKPGFNSGSS